MSSSTARNLEAPIDEVKVTYVGIPGTSRRLLEVPWKLWEPDEKAKADYFSVSDSLQSMKVWEHLSRGGGFEPRAAFGFYMAGRERSEARPCITIRTNSVIYGRRLRNAVLQQGWWASFKASVPRVCIVYIYCSPTKLAGPPLPPSTTSIPGDVFTFVDVKTYCGAPIFLDVQAGATTYQRPATLGGLLDVGGSVYGLMVAHAASEDYLREQEFSEEPMLYVHDDNERNDFEECEDSDPEQLSTDRADPYEAIPTESLLRGQHRFFPSSSIVGRGIGLSSSEDYDHSGRKIATKLGFIHHISSNFEGDLFDWAIVNLDTSIIAARPVNKLVLSANFQTLISNKLAMEPECRSDIVAATGSSGLLNGHLLSTPVPFQMEPKTGPLRVKEVILEKELKFGDSGSWIFNKSGEPYGVIFAGVTGSRVAYVLPLADMFEDIEKRLDTTVQLPGLGL